MQHTAHRFFSLHKLLTFFLFFFISTFFVSLTYAQNISERAPLNQSNYRYATQIFANCTSNNKSTETGLCSQSVNYINRFRAANPGTPDDILKITQARDEAEKVGQGVVVRGDGTVAKVGKKTGGWLCSEDSIAGCLSDLADFVIGNLVSLINGILSWILSIAMYLLDLVIYVTVVKFTDNFAQLNLEGFGGIIGLKSGLIYYIWTMLRDFVNLLLLITIIYYAARTMFEGFSDHKSKFLYLLVFSIVINFSLFFVKFAIDLSNILSLQAYTLMANPSSFENWEGFRKNSSGGGIVTPNATLGDYLLNVASIGGAHKASIGKDAAEQRINEGMKASWVYQVIVMLMYIGLIYLVFFLAGLLILRAAAFLFAMLLAALLAADIFFNTIVGNSDGKAYEFAASIKQVTDKIRDDFYEALIKGPVLFLFLFLVGVLSNAIFNQSLQSEITSITNSSKEFQVFGKSFANSLAIFLKFILFFALTKVLFEKLNAVKFAGQGEGKWLGGGSKAIGNFLMRNSVGRAARLPGFVGRNYIGRNLENPNSVLGRGYNAAFNLAKRAQANTGWTGVVTRSVGNAALKGLTSARKGSYEFDQSRLGQKFGNTGLGKKISDLGIGLAEDKGKGGFREREEQRVTQRIQEKEADAKILEEAGGMTQDDINVGREGTKVKLDKAGDYKLSLAELDGLEKNNVLDDLVKSLKAANRSGASAIDINVGKRDKKTGAPQPLRVSKENIPKLVAFLNNKKNGGDFASSMLKDAEGLAQEYAENKAKARSKAQATDLKNTDIDYVGDLAYDFAARAQTAAKISGVGRKNIELQNGKKFQIVQQHVEELDSAINAIDEILQVKGLNSTQEAVMISLKTRAEDYKTNVIGTKLDKKTLGITRVNENFANDPFIRQEISNIVTGISRETKNIWGDETVAKSLTDELGLIDTQLQTGRSLLPGGGAGPRLTIDERNDLNKRKGMILPGVNNRERRVERSEKLAENMKKHAEAFDANFASK